MIEFPFPCTKVVTVLRSKDFTTVWMELRLSSTQINVFDFAMQTGVSKLKSPGCYFLTGMLKGELDRPLSFSRNFYFNLVKKISLDGKSGDLFDKESGCFRRE